MSFETTPFESLSEQQIFSYKLPDGKLHLFNNIVCPFGQRSLWTAVEVKAPFHVIEVSLSDMPAAYIEQFNRYATVPFLLSNGYSIYESAIIAQYFDTKYGGGELFRHNDPEEATLAQLAAAKFEVGAFYGVLRNPSESNLAELKDTLDEVEKIYRENAAAYRSKGPYLLGNKLSSAEILTVPFLFRFDILLKHYHNHDLLDGYPLLKAALEASKTRPAFQETIREPQLYIDVYAKYVEK